MIFDERTVYRLENLSLAATRIRAGQIKGERRSPRKGASTEFADHRSYSQGDDLRRVDWNIYARSGRPYIKQYTEEEDLAVHILLDASESMDWGEGDENKFQYGLRLGGGLGLMALTSGDQLTFTLLAGENTTSRIGPLRGRPSLPRLLNYLEAQKAGGLTDLNSGLQNFSRKPGRAGLAILISDLFSPAGFLNGLRDLQKTGHEVILVQILSPQEARPDLNGELRLVDRESHHIQEVSMTPALIQLYHDRLMTWQREIKRECTSRGIHKFSLVTDQPWDQFILYELRRRGLVR